MTYYVIVVDNSASTVQVSHTGTSILDHAKAFVEYFVKQRKDRGDKCDIVTCDEYPFSVIRYKDGANFSDEVKQIKPTGCLSVEAAVGRAFWILAINRKSADNVALGRRLVTDPGAVILLTDGGIGDQQFAPDRIPCAVNSFYTDVWRADQRFYAVNLRFPSRLVGPPHTCQNSEQDAGRFSNFAQATGGCSYVVSNPRQLLVTADSVISKTSLIGMRINYMYIGPELEPKNPDKTAPWKNGNITVHAVGPREIEWGLPEAFWPESVMDAIPARAPVPQIQLTYSPNDPPVFKEKNKCRSRFEVEPSELTRFMIDREAGSKATGCYPICVPGSSKGPGMPVGYFKVEMMSRNGEVAPKLLVNLYVSTYNYLKFATLHEQLVSQKPVSSMIKNAVLEYLKSIPVYYISNSSPLMLLLGQEYPFIQSVVNRQPYNKALMATLVTFLQTTKNELAEYKAIVFDRKNLATVNNLPEYDEMVVRDAILSSECPSKYKREEYMADLPEKVYIEYDPPKPPLPSQMFTNALYIPRKLIFECLTKMRVNYSIFARDHDLHVLEGGMLGQKIILSDAEDLHSRPIKEMGEFRPYDRQKEAIGFAKLREVTQKVTRAETFGNPFKQDKRVSVDEINEEEGRMQQRGNTPVPEDRMARANSPMPPIASMKSIKDEKNKISLSTFSRLRYRKYRSTPSGINSVASSRQGTPMPDEDIYSKYDNGPSTPITNNIIHTNGKLREESPAPALVNGMAKLAVKRAVSFSEDTEESEPESPSPVAKRRRESIGADGGLNYSQLVSKKVDVTVLIKSQIRSPVEKVLTSICNLTDGLSRQDKSAIYQKALDVARGLSGSKLISMLEKEVILI